MTQKVIQMKKLTEKEYLLELNRIKKENVFLERNIKLQEEKNKLKKRNIKLPSTTKLIAVYLFLILNAVLIYSMYVMYNFRDLTYLGVLITDIAAQVLIYLIYTVKATRENTVGGITYDLAMRDKTNDETLE